MLSETDYPLPSAFQLAYTDSEILAVEVDLERYCNDSLWERRRAHFVYPESEGLQQEIPESTLLDLSRYCVMRDVSLRWITQFRPGVVANIHSYLRPAAPGDEWHRGRRPFRGTRAPTVGPSCFSIRCRHSFS
jgi:uncharacterized protein YbaP (TraB family)